MDTILNILLAGILLMLIINMYPQAKAMIQHGPKAQKGDWNVVSLIFMAVIGFVILLILLIRP